MKLEFFPISPADRAGSGRVTAIAESTGFAVTVRAPGVWIVTDRLRLRLAMGDPAAPCCTANGRPPVMTARKPSRAPTRANGEFRGGPGATAWPKAGSSAFPLIGIGPMPAVRQRAFVEVAHPQRKSLRLPFQQVPPANPSSRHE
jgi:hypothetical protein